MNHLYNSPAQMQAFKAAVEADPEVRLLRLYVCGPMTGIADRNYPAFNTATDILRACGYLVENPVQNVVPDPDAPEAWQQFMRLSLIQVARVDGIATLPNWHTSRGASLEVYVGTHLGLPIKTVAHWVADSNHDN